MDHMYFFDTSDAPIYFRALYQTVTNAIRAMEQQNYGIALDTLRQGEQTARQIYLHTKDGLQDMYYDM